MAVVGGAGSGKSTVAAALATTRGQVEVELDALWWGPNWIPVDLPTFQGRVTDVVTRPTWIVEGFYVDEAMVPIIWPAADTIVWLDLPRRTSVVRALRRSVGRVLKRELLWGTNRQSVAVLTPASITRFVRRWPTYPARIDAALRSTPALTAVVRLRSDAEVRRWLREQEQAAT